MAMHKAKLYSVNNYEQVAAAENFFSLCGEKLRNEFGFEEISLIDIGTGCGTVLSEVIVKKSGLNFSKVIGVDISHEMIKHSSETYGNDLIQFRYMDAEGDIPEYLKDQKFDMATSFYACQFIKDIGKSFKNVYDLLNPGGLFCCIVIGWHLVVDIWRTLDEKYAPYTDQWKDNCSPLWFSENVDELVKNHLSENGFEIVEFIDSRNEVYDYRKIENFSKAMRAVTPCLKNMPENLHDSYMKDLLDVLFSMQTRNPTCIPRRLLYIVAKK